MIGDRHSLAAFVAVLVAIVLLALIAGVLCAMRRPYEAIGVGGAMTGLIGVLGTFRPAHSASGATSVAPQSTTEGE